MDIKKIEEKVKQIIMDSLFGVDENEVKPESKFVDDLGADSIDKIEIVMFCEDEFDIEISDEDAERIKTVGDAVEYLSKVLE